MYRCRVCDREFPEPVVKEERLGDFYERVEGCPYCGDPGFEALHPCPTCNGWTAGTICKKCRGRVLHEWGVFLRSLEPDEIEWLQNKVDGDAWDEYR